MAQFQRLKQSHSARLFAQEENEIHSHQRIGRELVKSSQAVNLHQTVVLSRVKQTVSSPSTVFSSPGSFIEWRVEPTALRTHVVFNERFEISVTNSSGTDVRPLPLPLWVDHIDYVTNDSIVFQRIDGQVLWDTYLTLPLEKLKVVAEDINLIPDTLRGRTIRNGETRIFYLDPLVSWINQIHPFISHLKPYYVRLYVSSTIMETGQIPNLNYADIVFSGAQLGPSHYNQLMSRHSSETHDYKIYTWLNMQWDQTLSSSQQYTTILSGIKGLVTDVFLSFRLNPIATSPNSRVYYPVDSYDFLDAGGISIVNDQVKDPEDRFVFFPEKFGSRNSLYMPIYHYSFCEDIKLVVNNAVNLGSYYFTGYEQLRYNTPASVTNAVITLTPNANPTAGNYRLSWTDPLTGDTEITQQIPFNDTAANIKNALESLQNFRGVVTVSGPLSGGAITFTFSGAYSICARSILASHLVCIEDTITPTISVASSLSTPGVNGFVNSGSAYTINILARTFAHLKIKPSGDIEIANTY